MGQSASTKFLICPQVDQNQNNVKANQVKVIPRAQARYSALAADVRDPLRPSRSCKRT